MDIDNCESALSKDKSYVMKVTSEKQSTDSEIYLRDPEWFRKYVSYYSMSNM